MEIKKIWYAKGVNITGKNALIAVVIINVVYVYVCIIITPDYSFVVIISGINCKIVIILRPMMAA